MTMITNNEDLNSDSIDHGSRRLEDCIWAVIERYEDGTVFCPITETGGSCEECYQILEEHPEYWEGE